MTDAAGVQAAFAAVLVDEWARAGLTDAVVAPGSRSTPLLAALAADGRLRLHVVLDERSAGFTALGLGLATGRPAPVVTTSGTAAVELHPAVVEADQAGVPLLAVTADRPPELHRVGAPQTVVQAGLFGGSVRFSADPGVADAATAGSWRSLASRVALETTDHPCGPGPVHLNLHFREPLLGPASELPAGRPDGGPWHAAAGRRALDPPAGFVTRLAAVAGDRGLVVAGAGAGAAALRLGEALRWPVLADPRSGARRPHPLVVAAADALLRADPVRDWRPDHVLRLGRPWASKVLAQWLGALPGGVTQVLVDPAGAWSDPERTAGLVVAADPGRLAAAVAAAVGAATGGSGGGAPRYGPAGDAPGAGPSGAPTTAGGPAGGSRSWSGAGGGPWAAAWAAAEAAAQKAVDAALAAEGGPTEPAVARVVAAALPAGSRLVVASSMPVRDVEWWAAPRPDVEVVANRGANGIDGVVSTALGVALAGGPVVALVGDLAFLYDAGALLWADQRAVTLTVVVVDNDGGGIFSFLPQASALPAEQFERYWGTPHGGDVTAVARAYGVPARFVDDLDDLAAAVARPVPGVSVVVVRTDRTGNVAAHHRLNAAVAEAVAGLSLG